MEFVGNVLLGVLFLALGLLYLMNCVKLFRAIQMENYKLLTIIRGIGIFLPFIGVVMGLV